MPDTASAFEALRSGKADVVVTGHFYTPERDREFDFTYSIMNAGQQVMVRAGGHGPSDHPLRTFLELLFFRPALLWFASAFLLVLIPAHLLLFFGKRSGELIPRDGSYFNRLFSTPLAWSTEVLVGQVPSRPQDESAARLRHLLALRGNPLRLALRRETHRLPHLRAVPGPHLRPG